MRPSDELIGELVVADDRPRHQLREERDIAGKLPEIADRRDEPAIDIYRVAHALERVEGDADGEHDVQQGYERIGHTAQMRSQPIHRRGAQIVVLEETQKAEVAEERHHQPAPARARCDRRVDLPSGNVINHRETSSKEQKR